MKKIILFLTIAYVSITAIAQKPSVNYARLINAIGTVESRMTDNAVNGSHAGFLQKCQKDTHFKTGSTGKNQSKCFG